VDRPRRSSSSRWFRANLWLHRWVSLVATLPFLVLCLTGTVLIFHGEIDDALGTVPVASHPADAPRRPSSESIANVLAAHPDERVLGVSIDDEHHPGVLLVVTGARDARGFEEAEIRYADRVTAQPVGGP
jgi:uncharacterized iron-regulated membrane protein